MMKKMMMMEMEMETEKRKEEEEEAFHFTCLPALPVCVFFSFVHFLPAFFKFSFGFVQLQQAANQSQSQSKREDSPVRIRTPSTSCKVAARGGHSQQQTIQGQKEAEPNSNRPNSFNCPSRDKETEPNSSSPSAPS
jgi:hypothetical protein